MPILKVAVKELPEYLQKLVKLTGKRPKMARVNLSEDLEVNHHSYNSVSPVVTFGVRVPNRTRIEHWQGSDGEGNSAAFSVYTAPTCYVEKASTTGRLVAEIFLTGLPEELVTQVYKVYKYEDQAPFIQTALDHALVAGDKIQEFGTPVSKTVHHYDSVQGRPAHVQHIIDETSPVA